MVVLVTLLLAGYGVVTSFENQAETTEAATIDRVNKQKEYMEKYAGKSGSLQMVANDDEGSDDGAKFLISPMLSFMKRTVLDLFAL